MIRVIDLAKAALADFDQLYDLIAKNNPRAAANTLRRLDDAIHLLIDQPRMGRVYHHARLRLRVLVHRDYLVFYRERPGIIEIVRVLAGSSPATSVASMNAAIFTLWDAPRT